MEKFFVQAVFGLTIGVLVWKSAQKRNMNHAAWGIVSGLSCIGGILLPVLIGIVFLALRSPLSKTNREDSPVKGAPATLATLPPFDDADYRGLVDQYTTMDEESLRGLMQRKGSLRRAAVKALEEEFTRRGFSNASSET